MPWGGAVDAKGYGVVTNRRTKRRAHRVIWEKYRGRIRKGYVLHHRCGNRRCCNLGHLEMVTPNQHADRHGVKLDPTQNDTSASDSLSASQRGLLKQALVAHYRRPLDIACQSPEPGCFRLYLDDIGERRERARARASAGRSLARLIKRGLLESCSRGRWRLTHRGLSLARALYPEIKLRTKKKLAHDIGRARRIAAKFGDNPEIRRLIMTYVMTPAYRGPVSQA
jgi:hypothetical protein